MDIENIHLASEFVLRQFVALVSLLSSQTEYISKNKKMGVMIFFGYHSNYKLIFSKVYVLKENTEENRPAEASR